MRDFSLPLVLVVLFASMACSSKVSSPEPMTQDFNCSASKEFITTVNYLRDFKQLELSEEQILDVANKVSKGCTNAAKRFSAVHQLLLDARIAGVEATKVAIGYANATDEATAGFEDIFRMTYAKSGLDLYSSDALTVSRDLTLQAKKKSVENVKANFVGVAKFCLDNKELNLPKKTCADLAKSVTLEGDRYDDPIGPKFIELIRFLRDNDEGPKLTTADALKIAIELAKVSPAATDNFIEVYAFAVAKKGLKLGRKDAALTAKRIATYTTSAEPSGAAQKVPNQN